VATNTDEDRYPSIRKVVHKVLDEDDFPEGAVERLEVTCLASGEATWRVWRPREDDHLGGYYARL
jgi:hypothetical protein